MLEQATLIADPAPVPLGGAAAAGIHPDVKAVFAAVRAEGARPDIQTTVPARQPHRREPGMQVFGVRHGRSSYHRWFDGMATPPRSPQ
jgi:hypothetical protein